MGLAIIIPGVDYSSKKIGTVSLSSAIDITYNLTNCSVTPEVNTVSLGGELLVTVSARNSYCVLDNVTVTMGGQDITSTSYDNGTINIPSVSAGVTITASAAYTLPSGYTLKNSVTVPKGAYFNTGITPTSTYSFRYKYEVSKSTYENKTYSPHFLSGTNYYAPFARSIYGNANTTEKIGSNRLSNEIYPDFTATSPYVFTFDAFNNGNAIYVEHGGRKYTFENTAGSGTAGNLYLCCYGGNASSATYQLDGTIYGVVEIYNNGTPVSLLVPAMNSSNVVGFYDVVRNTFYSSSTNVAFT